MSFSNSGVRFNRTFRGKILAEVFFGLSESVLSIFFIITLAGQFVFPNHALATAGVSQKLSYQGRLTDTSGNPYTGTYYVCFSIFDAVSAGTKLWPTGVPANNTVTVTNGVFNVGIGDSDALTFDFSSNDTIYLNVGVSTTNVTCDNVAFENLAPRQRMDAVAYARVSANVYGTALRTSSTATGIGAGTGQVTPIWLNLDWKNTATTLGGACPSGSVNGSVWYNSSGTRALMCVNNAVTAIDNASEIAGIKEQGAGSAITGGTVNFSGSNNITISQTGSTLQFSVPSPAVNVFGMSNLGNTSGTTGVVSSSGARMLLVGGNNITLSQSINGSAVTITISAGAGGGGGIAIGAGTQTATSGTIVFQDGNNVTFGLNGQTLTASAPAGGGGGGGGFALQDFANLSWRAFITNVTNMTAVSQRPIFTPFVLPGSLTWNREVIEVSRATSGSNLFTARMGIYSFVNSTQISLMGSLQNTFSNTATASVSGIRRILLTGMEAGATALTPGHYVMGMYFSAAATASMNYSLRGGQTVGPPVGNFAPGANQVSTATSQLSSMAFARFLGRYTATTASMPSSVAFSQVQHWTSNYPIYFRLEST